MKINSKKILPLLLAVLAVALIVVFLVKTNKPAEPGSTVLNTATEYPLQIYDGPTPGQTQPSGGETSAPEVTEKPTATPAPTEVPATECPIDEDGVYYTKDEVALYIHLYGHLPSNFITKKEAQALGWTGGSLEPYAPGKCIGGDYFGNYEGQLPTKKGRTYHECDIGTLGKSSRGAKRIVFSNDGLIYYTGDHYEHFTLLYGGND